MPAERGTTGTGPARVDFVDYDPPAKHVNQMAVVLYFDPAADAAIRALADLLAASGFPNPIAARALRPHVTLAVCDGIELADQLRPALAEFAAETPRLACSLASLGVFPTEEGVLFLAPAASRVLVEVQEEMVDCLKRSGVRVGAYWSPGSWVPHCTLATGIQRQHLPTAIGVCHAAFRPIGAILTRLSLVDMDSACDCYGFDLMFSPG